MNEEKTQQDETLKADIGFSEAVRKIPITRSLSINDEGSFISEVKRIQVEPTSPAQKHKQIIKPGHNQLSFDSSEDSQEQDMPYSTPPSNVKEAEDAEDQKEEIQEFYKWIEEQ